VSDDVAQGNVIRTDPAAGTEVAKSQAITLFISSGAESVTVPGVEGLNEQNARSALEQVGLVVQVTDQDVLNPGQDGKVITQSPPKNSNATRGDTVTIFVGRFRPTETTDGGN
jgi:serine/threonine-protein kinase